METLDRPAWDRDVDVVVVGMGAAGSVAAIEAAERGARVLALDFWGRGGASARSGGVIYAGGGTPQQHLAGFTDDPVRMQEYLDVEEGVADDDELMHAFCERSRDDLAWLVDRGVGIPAGFDDTKTIVPTDDRTGLYFSGNEKHYASATPPVARGHRVAGHGMTGANLVATLHEAARRRGVEILDGARLVAFVDADGAVVGVDAVVLPRDRATRVALASFYRAIDVYGSALRRVPRWLNTMLDHFVQNRGTPMRIRARQGVILATGGFSYNRAMLAQYAPAYEHAMPLGTPGDDGSGLICAQQLGAAVRLMDRCGASRFIAPPVAFCAGVLVDQRGERICDETLYAASLSARIAERGGRAWLIVDDAIRAQVPRQIRAGARLRDRPLRDLVTGRANHVLFPKVFGRINLYLNRRRTPTLDELAHRCGIPGDALIHTVHRYNERARTGLPDEMGKATEHVRPLEQSPYSAIACHLDSIVFPAPCITLGGLDVDAHQRVRREDGSVIDGLYAAGRCAAGVASRSYVSGLSLADCVFSGRNAGIAVTAGAKTAVH